MTVTPESITFPSSINTVSVKIYNTLRSLEAPSQPFFSPATGSKSDESARFKATCKSFLVEHPSGRKLLFDLGVRKDQSTVPTKWKELLDSGLFSVGFGLDAAEILVESGFDLKALEAVIWSHPHFDHTGNPSTFPSTTALVVGPGVLALRPGYPINPKSGIPDSDFEGREVIEIAFEEDAPLIAGMRSYDYFGDGSFYLLDAPGHCVGHILGLARTTGSPDSFILMAGDTAHHSAMLRPSPFVPVPENLKTKVPKALRECAPNAPWLSQPTRERSIHDDHDMAYQTFLKVQALDGREDVLVVTAHDLSMEDGLSVKHFPAAANNWKNEGAKEKAFWAFLEPGNAANRWHRFGV